MTPWVDGDTSFGHHGICKGYISCDHDVMRFHLIDDVGVSDIGPLGNLHHADEVGFWGCHVAIGHEHHFNFEASAGLEDDLFDYFRASVVVDPDLQ